MTALAQVEPALSASADRSGARLDIRNVSKSFVVNGAAVEALKDVSLDVAAGEFVVLLGPSGCGKSTLLRLVAGLDRDFRGSISQDGEPVAGTSLDRGIVFQEPRLFPWATVTQNIALGLKNAPLSERAKRETIAAHISLVGLDGFAEAYPHQLSGGMAQRAAIARGLVNRPRLLLLDEPFGALDALTRARLQLELQRIWAHEKISMILVTHDVDEAVLLGDRIIVLAPRPGRVARIFDVTVPRPRSRSSDDLVRTRNEILRTLGEGDGGTVAQGLPSGADA
ncbi:ABC transporter ATP-binding protein [Bradyrhizobium arachidis]|uniref:ABC transporter ATP-binding protein n=1 Tax=Bradyrhizobium arachidis TaxID=858423 RepID=A0AAE7NN92_9BRAD|nr:ABC transporter ATP-binding protein [Bradyrhizobium arachidis]QOZ67366.1 ABC transporter ATP-binding protein [Bradyrhizobium arachidis]SFU80606.1 sulfonate transport system ATP-binding protein [Bradyrhizobium arachidis]